MKRASDILGAVQDGRWGGASARARAVADRWAAAAWLAARRGSGRGPDPALVRDALEAALLPAGATTRLVADPERLPAPPAAIGRPHASSPAAGPPLDQLPPAAVGPSLAAVAAEVDAL